jgi:microcystin-dependent protein
VSTAFVGEVRLVGFNFAPSGWSTCQGQSMPITNNEALYTLIGTTYGGDGQSNFNLPNLAGRIPIHQGTDAAGNSYVLGQIGGSETVTVAPNQLPAHTHTLMASGNSTGAVSNPANNVVASAVKMFTPQQTPTDAMNPAMVTVAQGGGLPHENRQPYQVLNWIISLSGIFPSQG